MPFPWTVAIVVTLLLALFTLAGWRDVRDRWWQVFLVQLPIVFGLLLGFGYWVEWSSPGYRPPLGFSVADSARGEFDWVTDLSTEQAAEALDEILAGVPEYGRGPLALRWADLSMEAKVALVEEWREEDLALLVFFHYLTYNDDDELGAPPDGGPLDYRYY